MLEEEVPSQNTYLCFLWDVLTAMQLLRMQRGPIFFSSLLIGFLCGFMFLIHDQPRKLCEPRLLDRTGLREILISSCPVLHGAVLCAEVGKAGFLLRWQVVSFLSGETLHIYFFYVAQMGFSFQGKREMKREMLWSESLQVYKWCKGSLSPKWHTFLSAYSQEYHNWILEFRCLTPQTHLASPRRKSNRCALSKCFLSKKN